jgi:hypothetical protein
MEERDSFPTKIKLNDGTGTMIKRRREAVIWFRKYKKELEKNTTDPSSSSTFHGETKMATF